MNDNDLLAVPGDCRRCYARRWAQFKEAV
jgi:hypothetical protein